MRIAKVSMHTSPYTALGTGDGGGMNVVVRRQAEALAALGHDVDIFTRRDDPELPDVEEPAPGVRLHHLTAGPPKPLKKSRIDAWIGEFREALAARITLLGGVDLIHSHHWMSGVAALPVAREFGVPHLQSYHSIAALPDAPLAHGEVPESPHRVPGEALVARESDLVLAVSTAEAATVVDRCGGDADRIVVLSPGVDADMFRPLDEGEPRWQCCSMGRPYLMFAARLQPLKGPDLALEALSRIDPAIRPHLLIAGEVSADFADYHAEIEALAHELGVAGDVVYAGARPREEFAAMMRGARLVLVPSHSETFGLVALEAAASGVPTIASDTGGLTEAVTHGTSGVLIPTRDPSLWAHEIEHLLTNPAEWTRLARSARDMAVQRDWNSVAERLADVYAGVVDAGRVRS